jgi:hypothetical protein
MPSGYVYNGKVMEVTPEGPLVQVPLLGGEASLFGPLPTSAPSLEVGERVIVGAMGSSANLLHVLDRAVGRWPNVGEVEGLTGEFDTLAARATALEGRATTVEGRATALESRATAIEGVNTTQNNRMTTIEGVNTTQDGRLTAVENRATAIEGVNTTQNTNIGTNTTAITTLRADTAGKVTTKGDLLVGTASGVLARQAVGANGLALVADSTQTNGIVYSDIRGLPVGGTGLTGAANATRFVGATTSGKPITGAFLVGDYVIDRSNGQFWVCTVAGSPGTWVSRVSSLPLGIIARARRTSNYAVTNSGEEVRFTVLNMSLLANRIYRIRCHCPGGIFSPGGAGFGLMSLRYTTNATTPTVASTRLVQTIIYVGNVSQNFAITSESLYVPPADQTVSVAVTTQCAFGGYSVFAAADYPLDFTVEDCGPTVTIATL